MKKALAYCLVPLVLLLTACSPSAAPPDATRTVVATTGPVCAIAAAVIAETDGIALLPMITEQVSCLHDYTLTTADMKLLESADVLLVSGAGLEPFLDDVLPGLRAELVDCSQDADLIDGDPHYWLDPANAAAMARTIGTALGLDGEPAATQLEALAAEGRTALSDLSCRALITFHDGFAYLARALDLTVLRAIEEEDGATASARELAELIELVRAHNLPAVFTEVYGSASAAEVITRETGVQAYPLTTMLTPLQPDLTGLERYRADYLYNVSTLREALK